MKMIMKTWVFLFFVCTLQLSATTVYSQQQRMDIFVENASLSEVFTYIRQHSDYTFVYDSDAVKRVNTISIDLKDASIDEILTRCLAGTGFTYLVDGNLIIIREQGRQDDEKQPVTVKGTVKDAHHQPMPGVTVLVKEMGIGAATDANGRYRFVVPVTSDTTFTLSFSFVGYETVEVKYTGQDSINVVLKETAQKMAEVVVTLPTR